jgi:PAS domain S-box-containing protein
MRRNVTEFSQAAAELRFQSEVMKHLPGGVVVIRTSDGVMLYANSGFEEMFGYGPGELAGQHVSIVNAPGEKSPEEVAREIIVALMEQGTWRGEVHNIKKDGTPFWCYAHVSTFEHHEYGKVWIAIHTDITERKRMEEDIYRKMYDNAPDMLASIDPNTAKIVQCNQTIATALGYTKEELAGRSIFEVYHPDSIDRAKEAFRSFVKTGRSRNIELQLERKDGSIIDTSLKVSAIRDEQGNIIYHNLIWHDITERKQAEEALRENEERYKLVLAGADAAIWDWDVPAKRVLFSPRWKELHGLPDDEVSDREQE